MTPELRKEASELQLHKRGIRINVQLHVIEADEEVHLRTAEYIEKRLIALWAVYSAAENPLQHKEAILAFLDSAQLLSTLSIEEMRYLSDPNTTEIQDAMFFQRKHALTFLAWCAGLIEKIDLSQKPINLSNLLEYFPDFSFDDASTTTISLPIKLRRKDQIMDWSDLLYRLHWAVRHAALTNKTSPGNINPAMVQEWHHAVNWICHYDDEDDWDKVSTETTA
jgi:hypothetical protein